MAYTRLRLNISSSGVGDASGIILHETSLRLLARSLFDSSSRSTIILATQETNENPSLSLVF